MTVRLTGVNDAPEITSNGGAALSVNAAENQTAVTTIAAFDPEGSGLAWSLFGTDAGLFDISNAGVITFRNAPNFEAPSDFGGNGVYDLIVQVSDGSLVDTQAITVTVTNVNDAPVLDLDADDTLRRSRRRQRRLLSGGSIRRAVSIADLVVIDPDSTSFTATVTLVQVDPSDQLDAIGFGATRPAPQIGNQVIITITANSVAGLQSMLDGVIFTPTMPPNPTPGDRTITVVVNDGALSSNVATTTVTVAAPPEITSPNNGDPFSVRIGENHRCGDHGRGDRSGFLELTYSLSGADAGLFQISSGGVLSFISAPKFRNPGRCRRRQ